MLNQRHFSERDFPSSQRFQKNTDVYLAWACDAAEQARELWSRGIAPREILASLVNSRRELAARQNEKSPDVFGQPREKESVTHLNLGYAELITRAERGLTTFCRDPLRLDGYEINPRHVGRLTRQAEYLFLTGDLVPVTRIGRYLEPVRIGPYRFEAGTLILEHTPFRLLPRLMEDVFRRLEDFRTPGRALGCAQGCERASFFEAMYGFYQAMPFSRGSASLGKSFFAGLWLAIFNDEHSLALRDPDLMAMTARSQSEYVGETAQRARK